MASPAHSDSTLTPPESSSAVKASVGMSPDEVEIERQIAEYGGDAPEYLHKALEQAKAKRHAEEADRRAKAGQLPRRSRAKSTASEKEYATLHHTDSAFEAANRVISRSRRISHKKTPDPARETEGDPNKVDWLENDPENPQNWTLRRKWRTVILCAILTLQVTFASSAPSSAVRLVSQEFGVSTVVANLTTSLFLCGYVLGPIVWAPLSEMFGRRPIFLVSLGVYTLFQIGNALAPNIAGTILFRFFGGTFAAAPLTNSGGVIADTMSPVHRTYAMSFFSASVFLGPVIGPIVGGWLTQAGKWRDIYWVLFACGGAAWIAVFFLLPETYAPKLLAKRAARMRKEDPEKNANIYAELEKADFSFKSVLTRTIARPFKMLAVEPILLLVTIYLSVVYGLLYGLFSVFPIVFEQVRGYSPGISGLMFISIGLGTTVGAGINVYVQRHIAKSLEIWHGHFPPELRLSGAKLAGPPLVAGCFILGWTGQYANIIWVVPCIAGFLLGVSFTLVFISFLTYLLETYLAFSASALAANTIVRSAVGAAFPLFTQQWYAGMGIGPATSVIGGIAVLLAPLPFLFARYGARIRDGSQFAPCLDLKMRDRVEREQREAKDNSEKA